MNTPKMIKITVAAATLLAPAVVNASTSSGTRGAGGAYGMFATASSTMGSGSVTGSSGSWWEDSSDFETELSYAIATAYANQPYESNYAAADALGNSENGMVVC